MKKLFVILSSLFVITAVSDVYADNQNPKLNVDESCTARGVTVNETNNSVDVYVPKNASTDVNVRIQNSDGTTYNYDTRSNNVYGSDYNDHTTKYSYDSDHSGFREHNSISRTRTQEVDVKCYPK